MSTNDDSDSLIARVYDPVGLGHAIRGLRTGRGWTQQDLAEWLGVHRVTVAKLERGGSVDVPVALRAIALLGGVVEIRSRTGAQAKADG
jgi:HTH-type transcriptional regulator/antitoxin HipB